MKTLPMQVDLRDQRLAMKMLMVMLEDFSQFKTGLAAYCHFKTTATIDQWVYRQRVPDSRMVQLWEFYDKFVSEMKNPFQGRKTGKIRA